MNQRDFPGKSEKIYFETAQPERENHSQHLFILNSPARLAVQEPALGEATGTLPE